MLNVKVKLEKNQKIYENLRIRRKKFVGKSTGKEYYAYVLKYELKGHEVEVNFKTPDRGGYSVLDIVFDGTKKAYLLVEKLGDEKRPIMGYRAVSFDDDGFMYDCKISPRESTDGSNLLNIIRREDFLNAQSNKILAEAGFEDEDEDDSEEEPEEDLEPVDDDND